MALDPEDADTIRITPPDAPRSLSHEDRVRLFGKLTWKPKPGAPAGEVELERDWVKANLVTVKIPWAGLSSSGLSPASRAITVHRLAAGPTVALWEAWMHAGYLPLIRGWGGSWVARMKRGHEYSTNPKDLSNHAWGTAFDINPAWNRLGKRPARVTEAGSVEMLVPLAYESGWAWGGDFSTPDGMHFELARIKTPPPLKT